MCSLNIYNTYYRHSVKLLPHGPNTHYRHGSDSANMLKLNIYMYKVRFLISHLFWKRLLSVYCDRGVCTGEFVLYTARIGMCFSRVGSALCQGTHFGTPTIYKLNLILCTLILRGGILLKFSR